MAAPNVIVTAEDHERFQTELEAIGSETNAKLVYLIDKAGQQVASFGSMDGVDPTSLASLTAGNVAATEGVAALVGESEFSSLFHEGARENVHISVVCDRLILLIVFDERSSLGLVRLRLDQHKSSLGEIATVLLTRSTDSNEGDDASKVFEDLTEADIDALFG